MCYSFYGSLKAFYVFSVHLEMEILLMGAV